MVSGFPKLSNLTPLTKTIWGDFMTDAPKYTEEELNEFRTLIEMGESHNQMDRIISRTSMPEFIERVGRERCDEMFKVLLQEDLGDDDDYYE